MLFKQTPLKDANVIEIEKIEDERGFFARAWDDKVFDSHHLDNIIVQTNISFNQNKGTIRGLHYQKKPFEETKIIRCTKGQIYDVIIDLRKNSNTYLKWFGIELSEFNHKMLYVPKGFAHGFQTLKDNTEVYYNVSQYYAPEYEAGIRWNDPLFNITWPMQPTSISNKDNSWKFFKNE